jgi:putative membrane protein
MRFLKAVVLLAPGEALAHGAADATWWSLDPWIWAPLIALPLLYAKGLRRLPRAPPAWKPASFALAIAALFLALVWPLDVLAGEVFAAHMAQHMLLIAAAAPLLVASDAGRALFHALPAKRLLRRALAPWHSLALPRPAFALHAAAIWVVHAPLFIHWAAADRWVHIVEHAALLGTALLFWSALARRSTGAGGAALYTLGTMIHTGMLGALLTFAPRLLYAGYTLEDQQLAGLIMWVPGGALYLLAGLAFSAAWLRTSGRAREPGAPQRSTSL